MHKIRVLSNCRLAVVKEDNTIVRRDCVRGETVYVPSISEIDIKDRIYSPYKKQILEIKKPVKVEENIAQEDPVLKAISGLQNTIIMATEALKEAVELRTHKQIFVATEPPKDKVHNNIILATKSGSIKEEVIDEDLFIDESEPMPEGYTQLDYQKQHSRMRDFIAGSVNDDDRKMTHQDRVRQHMPLFANTSEFKAVGEEVIETDNRIENTESSAINVVKTDTGKIDVFKSLGMEIINR